MSRYTNVGDRADGGTTDWAPGSGLCAPASYLLALTGMFINLKAFCAVDSSWGLGGEIAAVGKDTTAVEDTGEKAMNG